MNLKYTELSQTQSKFSDDMDNRQKEKELLQKKFLEINKKSKQETILKQDAKENNVVTDEEINNYRKKISKLQADLDKAKLKISEKNKQFKNINEDNKVNKKIIFDLKNNIDNLQEIKRISENKYNELLDKYNNLNNQLIKLKDNNIYENKITALRFTIDKLENQNIKYQKSIENLTNRLKNMQTKLLNKMSFNYSQDVEDKKKKIENLNKQVKSLIVKNKKLQTIIISMEDNDINLINATKERLVKVSKSIVKKIQYYLLLDWYKDWKNEKLNKEFIIKSSTTEIDLKEEYKIEYGYVTLNEFGEYYFNSVNNDKYPIIYSKKEINVDIPCKVGISNNQAYIFNQYKENDIYKSQNIDRTEENIKLKKDFKIGDELYKSDIFKGYSILIIGSRSKKQYVDLLSKQGATVMWYNPFEENLKRLDEKYKYADIVLVCTRHISHSIYNHIDISNKKVQQIKRDDNEVILARARFALITLGLI